MKKWIDKGFGNTKALRFSVFAGVLAVFVASGLAVVAALPQASAGFSHNVNYPPELRSQYASLVQSVGEFKRAQRRAGAQIVSEHEMESQLSRVQLDAASGQFHRAKADIKNLRVSLANWNFELKGGTVAASKPVSADNSARNLSGGLTIPILLYHYTPANFEQQLSHLQTRGYTTITMDEALSGLNGGSLPAKPVVITYDDGFANQMQAFEILRRHNMKATFYIITSGAASQWCIGSGRRYNDPLQPPGGCGDAYMNWSQVRELDHSGLIEIGGHTVNHRNLATLPADEQRFEIADGKRALEDKLGHTIRHFAYPYGAYNATSIQIARDAGYQTAVTVQPGSYQNPGSEFTLRRVRDALILP
ncbi:MAG: polysaccharide deacetylase [Patescibacteria group bacterium]|nr:polysaccharide deacetylase [Patescibacteria group bacterium]